MAALLCASYAFDTIMVFQDRFRNHILPDQVHMLNVAFLVPEMRREFGGCAGNMAYNLRLLGEDAVPMATVGEDFAPYAQWLEECGIDATHIRVCEGFHTGQAFITTDLDDNQITAFHPGAMNASHRNHVDDAAGITIGIVGPDGRDGMLQHAREFADSGIPFIFDPGQGLPMFSGEELLDFIEQATWVAVNDYEREMLQHRTGLSLKALAERVEALVVTRGGEGSVIHVSGSTIDIPPVRAASVVDPTGCGDAYRAGLLHGLMQDYDWPTVGRIGSLLGSVKVASAGTQNHRFSPGEIEDRFVELFGYRI